MVLFCRLRCVSAANISDHLGAFSILILYGSYQKLCVPGALFNEQVYTPCTNPLHHTFIQSTVSNGKYEKTTTKQKYRLAKGHVRHDTEYFDSI